MTTHLYSEEIPKDIAKELFRKCFLSGVRIKNLSTIRNHHGAAELVMQARTVGRGCVSVKKILPIISEVFGLGYYLPGSDRTTIHEQFEQFIFIQESRFRMLTGVARRGKGCSKFNGDNFLISRLDCGKTTAAIADGMGSGKRAFIESRMVIELMENCIEAGFEEKTAIDLINSAYIAGTTFNNPVTMDMSVIDCQAGVINCIKLGAVSTFIKRDNWVEIIKSTTLPMGVLDQVDYDCTTKKLYDGNYIIMISDGVLDNLSGVNKEEQMVEIINNINVKKPASIAKKILEMSLKNHNMEAFDDCTVMVLGVFDTYVNV